MFSLKFKILHYIYFRTSEFGHKNHDAQYCFALWKFGSELLPVFLHPHPFLKTLIIKDKILTFGAQNNIDSYQNIGLFLFNYEKPVLLSITLKFLKGKFSHIRL